MGSVLPSETSAEIQGPLPFSLSCGICQDQPLAPMMSSSVLCLLLAPGGGGGGGVSSGVVARSRQSVPGVRPRLLQAPARPALKSPEASLS